MEVATLPTALQVAWEEALAATQAAGEEARSESKETPRREEAKQISTNTIASTLQWFLEGQESKDDSEKEEYAVVVEGLAERRMALFDLWWWLHSECERTKGDVEALTVLCEQFARRAGSVEEMQKLAELPLECPTDHTDGKVADLSTGGNNSVLFPLQFMIEALPAELVTAIHSALRMKILRRSVKNFVARVNTRQYFTVTCYNLVHEANEAYATFLRSTVTKYTELCRNLSASVGDLDLLVSNSRGFVFNLLQTHGSSRGPSITHLKPGVSPGFIALNCLGCAPGTPDVDFTALHTYLQLSDRLASDLVDQVRASIGCFQMSPMRVCMLLLQMFCRYAEEVVGDVAVRQVLALFPKDMVVACLGQILATSAAYTARNQLLADETANERKHRLEAKVTNADSSGTAGGGEEKMVDLSEAEEGGVAVQYPKCFEGKNPAQRVYGVTGGFRLCNSSTYPRTPLFNMNLVARLYLMDMVTLEELTPFLRFDRDRSLRLREAIGFIIGHIRDLKVHVNLRQTAAERQAEMARWVALYNYLVMHWEGVELWGTNLARFINAFHGLPPDKHGDYAVANQYLMFVNAVLCAPSVGPVLAVEASFNASAKDTEDTAPDTLATSSQKPHTRRVAAWMRAHHGRQYNASSLYTALPASWDAHMRAMVIRWRKAEPVIHPVFAAQISSHPGCLYALCYHLHQWVDPCVAAAERQSRTHIHDAQFSEFMLISPATRSYVLKHAADAPADPPSANKTQAPDLIAQLVTAMQVREQSASGAFRKACAMVFWMDAVLSWLGRVVVHVGANISGDHPLLSKLLRLMLVYTEQWRVICREIHTANSTDSNDQCMQTLPDDLKMPAHIQRLLTVCVLPAISQLTVSPHAKFFSDPDRSDVSTGQLLSWSQVGGAVSRAGYLTGLLWQVLSFYPYQTRYALYQYWDGEYGYSQSPEMALRATNVRLLVKNFIKRVSKTDPRNNGQRLMACVANNPVLAWDRVLVDMEKLDNLVPAFSQACAGMQQLHLDTLVFCILRRLSRKHQRPKMKADGVHPSNWVQSLSLLMGTVLRDHAHRLRFDFAPILQYLINQLKQCDLTTASAELLLLRQILSFVCGVEDAARQSTSTVTQLLATSQGPLLHGQHSSKVVKPSSRSRSSTSAGGLGPMGMRQQSTIAMLCRCLRTRRFALPLWVLIAQQREYAMFQASTPQVEFCASQFDSIHNIFLDFTAFLRKYYAADVRSEFGRLADMLFECHVRFSDVSMLVQPLHARTWVTAPQTAVVAMNDASGGHSAQSEPACFFGASPTVSSILAERGLSHLDASPTSSLPMAANPTDRSLQQLQDSGLYPWSLRGVVVAHYPAETFRALSVDFFLLFWTLRVQDVCFTRDLYLNMCKQIKKHGPGDLIHKSRRGIVQSGSSEATNLPWQPDGTKPDPCALEKYLSQLNDSNAYELSVEEARRQEKHCENVLQRVTMVSHLWFMHALPSSREGESEQKEQASDSIDGTTDSYNKAMSCRLQTFLSVCLFPRIFASHDGALFSALFLEFVFKAGVVDFSLKVLMQLLVESLWSVVLSCTSMEIARLGVFISQMLSWVERMRLLSPSAFPETAVARMLQLAPVAMAGADETKNPSAEPQAMDSGSSEAKQSGVPPGGTDGTSEAKDSAEPETTTTTAQPTTSDAPGPAEGGATELASATTTQSSKRSEKKDGSARTMWIRLSFRWERAFTQLLAFIIQRSLLHVTMDATVEPVDMDEEPEEWADSDDGSLPVDKIRRHSSRAPTLWLSNTLKLCSTMISSGAFPRAHRNAATLYGELNDLLARLRVAEEKGDVIDGVQKFILLTRSCIANLIQAGRVCVSKQTYRAGANKPLMPLVVRTTPKKDTPDSTDSDVKQRTQSEASSRFSGSKPRSSSDRTQRGDSSSSKRTESGSSKRTESGSSKRTESSSSSRRNEGGSSSRRSDSGSSSRRTESGSSKSGDRRDAASSTRDLQRTSSDRARDGKRSSTNRSRELKRTPSDSRREVKRTPSDSRRDSGGRDSAGKQTGRSSEQSARGKHKTRDLRGSSRASPRPPSSGSGRSAESRSGSSSSRAGSSGQQARGSGSGAHHRNGSRAHTARSSQQRTQERSSDTCGSSSRRPGESKTSSTVAAGNDVPASSSAGGSGSGRGGNSTDSGRSGTSRGSSRGGSSKEASRSSSSKESSRGGSSSRNNSGTTSKHPSSRNRSSSKEVGRTRSERQSDGSSTTSASSRPGSDNHQSSRKRGRNSAGDDGNQQQKRRAVDNDSSARRSSDRGRRGGGETPRVHRVVRRTQPASNRSRSSSSRKSSRR